jgi:hypothetical protein
MFGSETGVSLDGLVMLNSGEPRHNWLEVLKLNVLKKSLKRSPLS